MVCSISGSFIRALYLKVNEVNKKQAVVKELMKEIKNLTQVTDNETAIVHSVTKVDTKEELNDLEKLLEDQSEYAALVRLK